MSEVPRDELEALAATPESALEDLIRAASAMVKASEDLDSIDHLDGCEMADGWCSCGADKIYSARYEQAMAALKEQLARARLTPCFLSQPQPDQDS